MNQQRSHKGTIGTKRRMGALLLCGLMLFAASGLATKYEANDVNSWAKLLAAAQDAHTTSKTELIITITGSFDQASTAGDDAFRVDSSIKKITIHGGGHTITGNGSDQIMRIGDFFGNRDNVVTIENLTMTGGNAADSSTTETGSGGALFVGGDATLTDCTFTNNSANADGGAVFVTGNVEIEGGTFTENSAGADGGAVFAVGNAKIEGGTFEKNTAGRDGGTVNAGTATIEDSTFTENSAKQDGGAVYIYMGNPEIKNTEFTGNTADSDDSGSGSGGAVYHYDFNNTGTLTITDSEFTGNNVTTGGANPNNNNPTGGGSISSKADITFKGDNYFSGNSAGDDPNPSTDPDAPDLGAPPYGIDNNSNNPIDTTSAQMIEGKKPAPAPGGSGSGSGSGSSERIPADTRGTEVYQGGGLVSNATVYAEANTDSGQVGTVQAGAPIQLVRWGGGGTWCKIIYNNGNNSGWVQGRHIK